MRIFFLKNCFDVIENILTKLHIASLKKKNTQKIIIKSFKDSIVLHTMKNNIAVLLCQESKRVENNDLMWQEKKEN